jgi:hypothetical protein
LQKTKYERTGNLRDIKLAIECLKEAMDLAPVDDPHCGAMARNLRNLKQQADIAELRAMRSREQAVEESGIVTELTFTNFNPVGPGFAISRLS